MEWVQALADWPVAAFLRASSLAYIFVNAAHILSLALLVGAIAVLDLRLLGLFRRLRLAEAGPVLSRIAGMGLGGAVLTGFLLFSVRPGAYLENPAFLAKLAVIGLGLGNVAWLHASRSWRAALAGYAVAPSLRVGAATSLLVWAGAVLAGRWVGFLQ